MKKEAAVLHHQTSPTLLQLPHRTRDGSCPSSSSSSSTSSCSPFLGRLSGLFSPRKSEKRALSGDITGGGVSSQPAQSKAPKGVEFERVFKYFDENGDGKISPSELRSCMRTVGEELSAEDAETVVASSDSDGDGLLGFDDFVRLVEVEGEGEEERNSYLREAFGMYEMEGLDCITPKSLRRTLSRLGESRTVDECTSMIRSFDLNGDGVITFDEFRVMML